MSFVDSDIRDSIAKIPGIVIYMKKWLVGIDEAGEKVWETFARGCQLFWKNSDNLNSFCKKSKVWVKNAGSILQDFLRFSLKIQEVDSFCKKTFARVRYDQGHVARLFEKCYFQKVDSFSMKCLMFLEFTKEMPTTCTVPVRKRAAHYYEKQH